MATSKAKDKPLNAYRVPAIMINFSYKLSSAFSSASASSSDLPKLKKNGEFSKATKTEQLFPNTDPTIDGDDCLHDCSSCSIKYPRKFDIDETEELYGHVKGWSTHLIVATGKTDWVRDVADEKGSIMEAVDKGTAKPKNGKLMLSASDIPVPNHSDHSTMVLLLPSWQFIDNVTPKNTPDLITNYINPGPTNTTLTHIPPTLGLTSLPLQARPCPHKYLILMCSQKTRDARCGQSAPLLRREFERILRPMGLYRDLHDVRPGGVGIYFISHVGGHKFSANVMIYRHSSVVKAGDGDRGDDKEEQVVLDANKEGGGEAGQCIWLARVRPEDCENIVRYTVLQGKVVKAGRQLRGGFDRSKQLVSW
ncbi:Sucrase/ferredoxin-like-domain-containing protein [Phaeosphaeriaceae sp. PMI808]|nr:Sucrase/ferredoxin-like-domain-containing protein [Phaeosphaeriaceae sp. PMI808]